MHQALFYLWYFLVCCSVSMCFIARMKEQIFHLRHPWKVTCSSYQTGSDQPCKEQQLRYSISSNIISLKFLKLYQYLVMRQGVGGEGGAYLHLYHTLLIMRYFAPSHDGILDRWWHPYTRRNSVPRKKLLPLTLYDKKEVEMVFVFFLILGVMLGCSKHEKVPVGKRFVSRHRIRMRWSRDSLDHHKEHSEKPELWSTSFLLWRGMYDDVTRIMTSHIQWRHMWR